MSWWSSAGCLKKPLRFHCKSNVVMLVINRGKEGSRKNQLNLEIMGCWCKSWTTGGGKGLQLLVISVQCTQ